MSYKAGKHFSVNFAVTGKHFYVGISGKFCNQGIPLRNLCKVKKDFEIVFKVVKYLGSKSILND